MEIILYLCFILLTFIDAKLQMSLKIKKVSKHRSLLLTSVSLGDPSQRMNVVIDINSNLTSVKSFEPKLSKNCMVVEYIENKLNQTVDGYDVSGLHLKDHAEISNLFMHYFGFLLIYKLNSFNADLSDVNGILGLNKISDSVQPSKFLNDNWDSFINYGNDMMYNERFVKIDLTRKEGYYLSIDRRNDTMIDCERENKNDFYFNCFLNGIVLGNVNDSVNSMKIMKYAYFSTINQLIFCPQEDFDFIVEEFFANKIKRKECYIKELHNSLNEDNVKIIMCDSLSLQKMKILNFVFSDTIALSIEAHKLFISESNGEFAFGIATKSSNSNWIFGYLIMQFIPLGFNHENRKISFITTNITNTVTELKTKFVFPEIKIISIETNFNLPFIAIISLIIIALMIIGGGFLYKTYKIVSSLKRNGYK